MMELLNEEPLFDDQKNILGVDPVQEEKKPYW
jgi:hypothetical protein